MISRKDKAVLCDLARIAETQNAKYFVIGAGARFLIYDWPRQLTGGRGTTDWDIAVRVSSWEEFVSLKAALTSREAPFVSTAADHRLRHVEGRRMDIVPFGGVEAADRTVTYPHGETTHSVLGLSECEACCVDVDVGDGVSVRVVGPPGLVVLKAMAYLDRRPGMTHDVQDLDFMVGTHRDTLDDEDVFERAAEVLRDEAILYEDVGAFLLAMDVRALAMASEVLEPLSVLVNELTEQSSQAVDHVLTDAANEQVEQREALARRYTAFRVGLST